MAKHPRYSSNAMQGMHVRQLELGPMQNFVYLIGDPDSKDAAVIDPGWEVPRILDMAKKDGYRITRVFLTHHHFDHAAGVEELLQHVPARVYAHRDDVPYLSVPREQLTPVQDGDVICVGALPVTVLHTPGHTPGSQSLLAVGRLFTGDTLFIGSCGRCDLPGGDAQALYRSLSGKLRPLDDATVVMPGHNYGEMPSAPLGEEKRRNPFLAAPSLEAFLRLVG